MAVTNYYTVNGQIQGQQVLGEAEGKDYLLDASGNLVGVYQGDYLKADAAYDAFGNILDSWNISFYNFTWGGGHGYRQTGLAYSSVYVRARHYSPLDRGWTTRDPLWPSEMPYGYVEGRVPRGADYWGMSSQLPSAPGPGVKCTKEWNQFVYDYCNQCARLSYLQHILCQPKCDAYANDYFNACNKLPRFTKPPPGIPEPIIPPPSIKPPGPWVPQMGTLCPPSMIIPYVEPEPNRSNAPWPTESERLYDDCIKKGYSPWYCMFQRAVFTTVNFGGGG